MNITWKVSQLDRRASDGFVTTAHWTAVAVDEDYTASICATASFEGELVVPYDSLTEADVLAWVWTSVDKQAAEAALAAQIEAQKNPVQVAGVPWSN
jgi:hypothetical protein